MAATRIKGRTAHKIASSRLKAGAKAGATFRELNRMYASLPSNQQRMVGLYGAAGAAAVVGGTVRIVRYKNPNVRVARAARRSASASRQLKRSGIKPGVKVRVSSARAGSLRSKSDRLYSKAGSAENRLGHMVGKRKPRGQARLRIKTVQFPNRGVTSKVKFYGKTTIAAGAVRGLHGTVGNIQKVPKKGTLKVAIKAGQLRARSDRARYRANNATMRSNKNMSARRIAAANTGKHRTRRTRRDGKGRFAGSY